jgi:branched-subunit amino acid transport protein
VTIWIAIAALAAINFAIKAAGPTLLGDRPLPPLISLVVHSLAPALLAGLLIVQVLGERWREFDWTVVAGLGVIGVLWLLKRSQILCILGGVVVTVIIRLLL